MNAYMNIKYLFIGRATELKEIGELNIQTQPNWPRDSRTIFKNYCSQGVEEKLEQRNKVKVDDTGNYYYFYISDNYYFYIAVVDGKYPEALIFKLFDDIFKENIPLLRDDKGRLNSIGANKLKDLVNSYQDSSKHNNIQSINKDIDEIKDKMKENVMVVIGNVNDATELKNQSDKIAAASSDFHKQSAAIRKQTCIQNYKWWLLIGLCVVLLIIIIVVLTVPKGNGDPKPSETSAEGAVVETQPAKGGNLRFLDMILGSLM